MDYIPIVLAFAIAFVAIIGGTWDKNRTGISKLTTPGRWGLFLISMSLVYSIVFAYQQRDREQVEELSRKTLGSIVSFELAKSIDSIASPFRALYIENTGGNYIPKEDISFDLMLAEPALGKAQDKCLELRPTTFSSYPDSGTWNDIFRQGITSGIDRLDRLVDRYGLSMNSSVLDAIHDLQVNGSFSSYAYFRPVSKKSQDSSEFVPPCTIGQVVGAQKQYLDMLKRIHSLNDSKTLIR